MICQRCKSNRILSISAKCSDQCCASYKGREHAGYVPSLKVIDAGDGYGDYVQFKLCLECGQLQGEFRVPELVVLHAFKAAA